MGSLPPAFQGREGGCRPRAATVSRECFQVSGWHSGTVLVLVFMVTPGSQRGSSGKEDKEGGMSWCLDREGTHGEGSSHFSP